MSRKHGTHDTCAAPGVEVSPQVGPCWQLLAPAPESSSSPARVWRCVLPPSILLGRRSQALADAAAGLPSGESVILAVIRRGSGRTRVSARLSFLFMPRRATQKLSEQSNLRLHVACFAWPTLERPGFVVPLESYKAISWARRTGVLGAGDRKPWWIRSIIQSPLYDIAFRAMAPIALILQKPSADDRQLI